MDLDKRTISYETAVGELNAILEKLEKKDCSLQDMLQLTKRGMELVGLCEKMLDAYDGSIKEYVREAGSDAV